MDTIVSDISADDIDRLTQVLSRRPDYGIARPSQRWQTRQQQKIESLPKIFLRPKNLLHRLTIKIVDRIDAELMPPAAILCPCHEGFNAYIIRKIFLLLATEVTIHTDRLRSYPGKNPALAAFITRIDSINAYWVSKEVFQNIFGTAPHNDRFVRVGSGCEACILAAVGANGQTLADLRAQLVIRKEHNKNPRPGRSKRPTPRLLRFVESWIGHLKPQDAEEVRRCSEDVLVDLREVQPALREHKRHSRRPSVYQELRMSLNNSHVRQVPGRNRSQRRTRDGIPLPNPDAQGSAIQRNLAALHNDFSAATSVYRADSVLVEGEPFSAEVVQQFRAAFARSHPGASVPQSVPSNYDEYHVLLQERQRPGPAEPRPAHASGSQGIEESRQTFVNRFGREVPLPTRPEDDPVNPFQYQVPDGGYDDTYEAEFDERDPEAEARSEAKVSEWFMANQTRVNLNEAGEDDLHPAFQQQVQPAGHSTYTKLVTPQPLMLKNDVYSPARAAWTKADNAASGQEERGLDPNSDAWTDATVHTATDAAGEGDLSGVPPVPAMLSRNQQHGQVGYSESGHGTPMTVESSGATLLKVVPSVAPGDFPQVSPIGPNPSQPTTPFPKYNERARDSFANQSSGRGPLPEVAVPRYPPPSPMKPKGKPNKKYLFPDSEVGSRMTATNKRYLRQHRGIREVELDKNPFLRQDVIRSSDRSRQETPDNQRMPRAALEPVTLRGPNSPPLQGSSPCPPGGGVGSAGSGTPLSRQVLIREEQEWRETFGGNHELRPDDSASNVNWKKKRDSVTTLGAFIRQGAGRS